MQMFPNSRFDNEADEESGEDGKVKKSLGEAKQVRAKH